MVCFFIHTMQKFNFREVCMIILDVNRLKKSFGFGLLLDDISFSLNEGEKVALIGENGSGKSTLLKMIARLEKYDSGSISTKKDAVVEYLEQGDVADSRTGLVIDVLKSAFSNVIAMENKLHDYEKALEEEKDSEKLEKLIIKYSNLQEKFVSIGGYDMDMQINIVVNGLQIDRELLDRDFNSLSGGERTLINLARILLCKPDLLLLDEPTNHLDISRIEWLEKFICEYKGTVIIVSHDRYFLDKVVNKVIELNDKRIKIYSGNYTSFVEQKENEEVKEFQIYKVQQKKFEEMEKAIKRLKEWGKMADNPTFFRRAKAIQSNLDRLRETAVDRPKPKKELPINFVATSRGSQEVVRINNLDLTIGNKQLLNKAKCLILNQEKVAIIGENGTGKSTLIKSIIDNSNPSIQLGRQQKIGYLSQIIEFTDNNAKLLDYFREETNEDEEHARSILFNFQFFKKDMIKRVGVLSGGEKLRLKLAIILQQEINLLILDEPTNHIDIETREILEDTLSKFKGTLIFVSHDRYFINKLANKIIEFHNKKLYTFNGNYDEYLLNRDNIHSKY